MTLILGIETSCDETAAAVVADGRRTLSNVIASQHHLHERFAGVVPEIASRAHLERITPVVRQALEAAASTLHDMDAIAVGNRPGLIGSLLVGVSAAQALAWALHTPLIGIDHVRAHLYAATMTAGPSPAQPAGSSRPAAVVEPSKLYPAVGLVVSGGHTSLYSLASPTDVRLLGKTIDDAVGEAYDKAAVILGLPYPGGPNVDRLAQQGHADAVPPLPQSLLDRDSLDFSFSGLKTALLYRVRGRPVGRGASARFERSAAELTDQQRANLAAAFQEAAVGTLATKLERALEQSTQRGTPPRSVLIGGGVSANSLLRRRVLDLAARRGLAGCIPPMSMCLDNAAMVAALAFEHYQRGWFDTLDLPAVATTSLA